jgi:hypothetical protein
METAMSFQALKDKNPTSTLKRFMREVAPMQFVREIYVNAVEAGATTMRVYFDPQYERLGTKKLCFADDGKGMTAREMYEYLAQYNSSSKTTEGSYHDNFGIGVKATTLLANPYGVVFLSWSSENPEGAMIWFTYDEAGDRVGLRPIEYIEIDEDNEEYTDTLCTHMSDGTRANVVALDDLRLAYPDGFEGIKWWECKEIAKIKEHGTIVMLLGQSSSDHSVGADWSERQLNHYFSSRFLMASIKIRSQNKIGSSGAPKGLIESLNRHIEHIDSVKADRGFVVDVFYIKPQDRSSSNGLWNQVQQRTLNGYCALAYKDELYNAQYGKREARSWGISHDDVISRVLLIVHPPHRRKQKDGVLRGCYPNERRDRLLWDDESTISDNRELDLTELKHYFTQNQPERLRKMLDEAYATNKQREQVDTSELQERYRELFKSKRARSGDVVKPADDGDLPLADHSPAESGGPSGKINPDWLPPELFPPKPAPPTSRPSPRQGKLGKGKTEHEVKVYWRTKPEYFDRAGTQMPFLVSYTRERTVIEANCNFSVFVEAIDHLRSMYESASQAELKAQVTDQVERYYETDLIMYALHYHAQQRKHPLYKGYGNEDLERALALRLLGSAWAIFPKIERSLSQLGYKKEK